MILMFRGNCDKCGKAFSLPQADLGRHQDIEGNIMCWSCCKETYWHTPERCDGCSEKRCVRDCSWRTSKTTSQKDVSKEFEMKLYVVEDHNGQVQCVCRRSENAEARIPEQKRLNRMQNPDKSWSFGKYDKWSLSQKQVLGDEQTGVKVQFVYVDDDNNLFFNNGEERKEIRILDNDGLYVPEVQ